MERKLFIFLFFITSVVFTTKGESALSHPCVGTKTQSVDGKLRIMLVQKKQNFTTAYLRDADIHSPKSVNMHPSGEKYYVNCLEGANTVVYSFPKGEKIKTIHHTFTIADSALWAPSCGLWPFKHYHHNLKTFYGKPVESVFTHQGRYLWVPYYRRSFDINAQDPSAVAVIDTRTDSLIRLFETGPLPKMITVSPDNHYVAISHWGNNTIGILDVHSDRIEDWHYTDKLVVDYELSLNLPMDSSVNRDVNSGYSLRGTVFTPDNKYLLVGCMGGGGGIAVIDMATHSYLGRILGMQANLRHLVIHDGWLYLSINKYGYIQKTPLSQFLQSIQDIDHTKTARYTNWQDCKVGAGARTIAISPDGKYLYAACNFDSKLYVVDVQTYKVVASIPVDSYPVGLDVSNDSHYVLVTSQGRNDQGGNAVNIYHVEYNSDTF